MTTAKEYRQYAEECLSMAKQAKTDSERDTLLKMAEDWLRAALLVTKADMPVLSKKSGGSSPTLQ